MLAGIATNKSVIRFNSAIANIANNNLVAEANNYSGVVSNYVVKGEVVSKVEGMFGNMGGNTTSLTKAHYTSPWAWLISPAYAAAKSIHNSFQNHSMGAVEGGLIRQACPSGCLFSR